MMEDKTSSRLVFVKFSNDGLLNYPNTIFLNRKDKIMKLSISSIVSVVAVIVALIAPTSAVCAVSTGDISSRSGYGYSVDIDTVNGNYIEFGDNGNNNHYQVKEKDVSPAFYALALSTLKDFFGNSQLVLQIYYVPNFYGTGVHKITDVWVRVP